MISYHIVCACMHVCLSQSALSCVQSRHIQSQPSQYSQWELDEARRETEAPVMSAEKKERERESRAGVELSPASQYPYPNPIPILKPSLQPHSL